MTEVLSIDRGDGLVGSKHPAKFNFLMQGSSYENERAGSTKQESQEQQSEHRNYIQHPTHSSTSQRRTSPTPKFSQQGMKKSEEMTTMRERYRFHDDEGSAGSKTNVMTDNKGSISSPSTNEMHSSPQQHGGNGNGSGLKRRHSQRSPSRPRSQQGSQAAQIATIKEVERENDNQRMMEKGGGDEEEGALSDDERRFRHQISADSPNKVARLDQRNTVSSSYVHPSESSTPSGWQSRANVLHQSESESTSATSSRVQMTNSHNSSVDEDPRNSSNPSNMRRRMDVIAESNIDENEQGANYTWQNQENNDSLPARSNVVQSSLNTRNESERSNRLSHLPSLMTGFQTPNAPSSAPVSATNAESGEPLSRGYERSSSPAPRLPGFAALSPYQPQTRVGGGSGRMTSPTPSINSGNPSGLSNISQHQHQHHQRRDDYGFSSHVITSPRAPGPSSMSANSPSLSHSSHQTPGQAFIHPSLAGLPGTGGDAGSKQQPSFVSKLYSMLEDDSIADMIAWGHSGTTFSVANPGEFAKIVLPNWFKHSNWQSFVRQLNMYGFHKVNHTYQGTPEAEIQVWEFKHPSFRRGEVHLLGEIKRKSSRHKRQDSMTRSMTNAADYEMMGTPSPEMGMMSHGHMGAGGAVVGGMIQSSHSSMNHPYSSQSQVVRSHHPGQGSIHHPYSRQQGGSSVSQYHEYPDPSGIPGSGIDQGALQSGSMHYSHHRDEQRSIPVQQSRLPHPESNVTSQSERGGGGQQRIVANENVIVRMDDLSDRIDAIIRHASYLESQLRTVSDQVYQFQQNDSSLRAHVHYLESQMRSLSDQLFQQRQSGGGNNPGPMPVRPFSPPPPQQQQQQHQQSQSQSSSSVGNAPIHPPGSPSSSSFSGRMRQLHPGSPTPSMRETGSGRFQSAGQQQTQGMPSFVSRSPSMGHPPFSNRNVGGHGSGMPLGAPPPPLSSSGGSNVGGRGMPASSADAYAKLRPPPVPGNVQRAKRDSPP